MSLFEVSVQTDMERVIERKITAEEMSITDDGVMFVNRDFRSQPEIVAFFPLMKIIYAIKLEDEDEITEIKRLENRGAKE